MSVLLIAVYGVLEDGKHQKPLALESPRAAERREVLGRQKNVGFEQAC
jgi:hypothetical protein